MKDYYRILEVDPSADIDTIRSAYRQRAFQWHPDQNRDRPDAEERFKSISEAYSILSDPVKRQAYDEARRADSRARENHHNRRADGQQRGESGGTASMNMADAMRQFMSEAYTLAWELSLRNARVDVIARRLVERGCPADVAGTIADGVTRQRQAMVRRQARGLAVRSLAWIVGGVVLLVILSGAELIWIGGLVVIGRAIWLLLKALYYLTSGRVPGTSAQSAGSTADQAGNKRQRPKQEGQDTEDRQTGPNAQASTWKCERCGDTNLRTQATCRSCGKGRSRSAGASAADSQSRAKKDLGTWKCRRCGDINLGTHLYCRSCKKWRP